MYLSGCICTCMYSHIVDSKYICPRSVHEFLACSRVLDSILSGDPLDEVIDRVQKYLGELKERIQGGHIELKKYVITKVCEC